LSVKDRDHGRIPLICTRSREGGVCTNRRHFYLDEIEGRVSCGLRQRLGSRAAIDRFIRGYAEERRRLAGDRVGFLEKLDRRLAAIDADLGRATDMLIRGILDEDKGASQIRALKSEKASLTAEREATVESVPDLAVHPAIADNYLASLGKLEDALRGPECPSEAREFSAVRDLVEAITVTPDANGSKPQIEVTGDLARFLAPSGYSSGGKVVAEEGRATNTTKRPGNAGLRYW
jgi:hypothetical protein